MKKTLALALVFTMITGLLMGCSGKASDSGTGTTASGSPAASEAVKEQAEEKTVTTTIWTDSQVLEPGILAAVEAFTKEHPTYTINVEAFPGSERPEKLALAKESGTLPSLFLTAFFTSADEVHQGTILPVTDIIKECYGDDMSEAALSTVEVNGDYYEVPLFTSPQGFIYNADMFKAAGLEDYVTESADEIACWTLEDMDQVILPTLKEYVAGTEKYVMVLYCSNEQNDSYLHNLLKMYDGNIFTDGMCSAGDDEKVIQGLEKIKEWYDAGYTNADAGTRLWSDCNADFRNQTCAISAGQFQTYLNHLAAFKEGSAEAFDARIAAVPCVKSDGSDSGVMHTYTYGFAMMNVDEDQLAVARQFLAWLSENTTEYVPAMTKGVPAMISVMNVMSEENPLYVAYQDAEKYLFDFTGGAPGWVSTRAVFYPEIQSTISGEKSPSQALADYEAAANEIIKEYTENSVVLNKTQ